MNKDYHEGYEQGRFDAIMDITGGHKDREAVCIVRCKNCKWNPYDGVEAEKAVKDGMFLTCPMWDEGDDGHNSFWHGEDEGFCHKWELK